MNIPAPHFLLFSEAQAKNRQGQWRFVLQAADGSATFKAADSEPGTRGERLELLAVVRGLEALGQPSRVTLFTPSKYVNRGIAYGLDDWRANDWTWERFGQVVPVKNRDLWQRFDHALGFHRIEFRGWRFDKAHARLPDLKRSGIRENSERRGEKTELLRVPLRSPTADFVQCAATCPHPLPEGEGNVVVAHGGRGARRHGLSWAAARLRRGAEEQIEAWKLRCAQLGTCFLPKPWIE